MIYPKCEYDLHPDADIPATSHGASKSYCGVTCLEMQVLGGTTLYAVIESDPTMWFDRMFVELCECFVAIGLHNVLYGLAIG
jgi:hypothetical protein